MDDDKVRLIIYVLFLFVYFYVWYESLKKSISKIRETHFPDSDDQEDHDDDNGDDEEGHGDNTGHGTENMRVKIEVPVVMQVIALAIYLAIIVVVFYFIAVARQGFAFMSKEDVNIFGFKLLMAELIMIATGAKICMLINDLYAHMLIEKSKANEKEYVITQTIALYAANFFIFVFGFIFAHLFLHAS
jgi:hypothetical protein